MRTFQHCFHIFIKNKVLLLCMCVGFAAALVRLLYVQRYYLEDEYGGINLFTPLEMTLSLIPYVFILFLVVSYEYFVVPKNLCLEEVMLTTCLGRKRRYLFHQFMVMTVFSVLFLLLFLTWNIIIYYSLTSETFGWTFDFDFTRHIFINLIVNSLLISTLAILAGMVIAFIKRRLIAYAVVLMVIYLSSTFLEIIANTLALGGVNIYGLRELFNVMPINLNFESNHMFGMSVLPYRIALILFWSFLCLFFILQPIKRVKLFKIIAIVLCCAALVYYFLPSSKVIMGYSPQGSSVADQWYYFMNEDNLISREEKADYQITDYTMELNAGRQLKATAQLHIDAPSLSKYKMTLYHGYKVKQVTNQNNEKLKFSQEGDYVTAFGNGKPLKAMKMVYEGYSAKYYSNYQGICLPGYFPYYPKAGYQKLGENLNDGWFSLFLEKDVPFDIRITGKQKIYTNLKEQEANHFVGVCNGPTIMSGFLKEKSQGKISVIYPYLSAGRYEAEKYGLIKQLDLFIGSLRKNNYKECTVFVLPNMNMNRSGIISKQQILSTGLYDNINELEEELQSDLDY